jgi:hypothetical protein
MIWPTDYASPAAFRVRGQSSGSRADLRRVYVDLTLTGDYSVQSYLVVTARDGSDALNEVGSRRNPLTKTRMGQVPI